MQKEYEIIDNIIYTPPLEHEIDNRGLGWYFYDKLWKFKDRIAQIDGLTGEKTTYSAILQKSIRTAIALKSMNISYGDVVSLCSYSHLDVCIPYIASMFVGAKIAAFHPSLSVPEATRLFRTVMPKILFLGVESVKLFEEVLRVADSPTTIVVFGRTDKYISFSSLIRPSSEDEEFKPITVKNIKDVAIIFFSSGSTGFSKGICHTHFSILSAPVTSLGFGSELITLTTDSPYWNLFVFLLYHSISNGGIQMIYSSELDLSDPWKIFSRKVNLAALNTTTALDICNSPKPKTVDLSELNVFVTGGSNISETQVTKIKRTFPNALVMVVYGQSEVFLCIFRFDVENPRHRELAELKPTSCGLPKPGILYKVVEPESGKILGVNQIGELRVKTNLQLSGYYNEESDDIWDEDGWLKTGDLAYYDEDCCFYVVDRIKEMFKYRYWHIVPAVLESILETHPAVLKAVVIGTPNEEDGHHPMAYVQLKENAGVTENDIVKFLDEKVEDRQRLRGGVKFITNFPLTVNNKISRPKLREMAVQDRNK